MISKVETRYDNGVVLSSYNPLIVVVHQEDHRKTSEIKSE